MLCTRAGTGICAWATELLLARFGSKVALCTLAVLTMGMSTGKVTPFGRIVAVRVITCPFVMVPKLACRVEPDSVKGEFGCTIRIPWPISGMLAVTLAFEAEDGPRSVTVIANWSPANPEAGSVMALNT